MKLKKKPKKILTIILTLIFMASVGFVVYKLTSSKQTVKETKVLDTIKDYGYELKDNKTEVYKKMFRELQEILKSNNVNEEKYVSKISEMFIYDFYSLADKTAKTDVGGIDFIESSILPNFLTNAEDTYYKYVESNIYGNRKQKLPVVDEISLKSPVQKEFAYGDKTDSDAYVVEANWTYTDGEFDDYQNEATLTFVHDGKKLVLVEAK